MSSESSVDIELVDGVAVLTFGDEERLTTLAPAMADALLAAIDRIEQDPGVRCLLLRGRGRAFAVGADLEQLRDLSPDEALAYNAKLIEIGRRVDELDVPSVACINGFAFGGGLELALACSTRIAADSASMGLPEVKVGILPGSGGLVRMPRIIGRGVALRLLLTGETVSAPRAAEIGLVDLVAPRDEVVDAAAALARAIAANPPLAVREILDGVREIERIPVADGLRRANERLRSLLETEDAREGIDAFLQKRAPTFTGR